MSRILNYNNIRKYTLTGLLLLATGITNHAQKRDDTNNSNNQNKNIIEQIDTTKIYVKENAGHKYYMSRLDVEKNLDELSRNAYLEDAWMFHNGILTDIGFAEDTLGVNIIEFLVSTEIANSKINDTIILYHIHPNSYIENRFSPPSELDIINHGTLKPKGYDKNVQLIQRMFDGRGMWEFDINEELVKKINKNKKSQLEQMKNIESVMNANYDSWDYFFNTNTSKLFQTYNQYSSEAIIDYINIMDKEGIKLKFTPKEDIGK
ncbi:MAG: hypothetical protein ACP5N1_05260 [Candidatus Woesearchaeota archaeon]